MSNRRKASSGGRDAGVSSPAQQDEADIVAEVGAEHDDSGELLADEAQVRTIGAIDAESVRENRRLGEIVDKKRGGVKGVPFNAGDLLTKYEWLIKYWPPNTLDISVKRLTGTAVQHLITSRPRSAAELYEAIKALHGQSSEAEYEIKFFDTNGKEFRGVGRVTMPDTRGAAPQQGQQPMQPFYAPPSLGYPPQPTPGYAPPPPHNFPTQAQPQGQVGAPAGLDMATMMASMKQMWDLFQSMQQQAQPPAAPPQAFAPPTMQQPAFMPPPPPPGADMAQMTEWMRQAFDMFRAVQPSPQPAYGYPPPPPQQQQPQTPPTPQGPNVAPPPGYMWGWIQGHGFALVPAPGAPSRGGGPFRPRPDYMPAQGNQEGDPPIRHQGPPPAQQRAPTMVEQFRESIGVVRTVSEMMNEMEGILPGRNDQQDSPAAMEVDDDSPIKIIDTGAGKIVVNKADGGMRIWESGFANLPDILKWGGEQIQKINKTNMERQQQQQQQQQQRQLPPGFVEVHPGYKPPPGYDVVPIDVPPEQQQQTLPPPPAHVPPPIQSPATSRQAWGSPEIPDQT